MKPWLWVALAAALGASLYVAQQTDDEAPVTSSRKRGDPADRTARRAVSSMRGADVPSSVALTGADQARLALVASALDAWRLERGALANWPEMGPGSRAAWGSQMPPPPPVVVPPPPPPPPPMAPPFPHAWVGRYVDGVTKAVLEGTAQTWVVKVNDVIEGQWRVDAIGERQIRLTYLPLQQSQTVNMKQ